MFKMILKTILLLCSLSLISTTRQIPSKEDCIALWNAVGGAGGDLKNVATKSGVAMGGVLKLYEDCLRSEEGIRYKRNYSGNNANKFNEENDRSSELMSRFIQRYISSAQ